MLFAVIPFRGHESIHEALQEMDATYICHERESGRVFFVEHDSTTKQLKDKIGLNGTLDASGIVLAVTNYNGFANPDLWEWLKNHDNGF